jgi:hypothetical protein
MKNKMSYKTAMKSETKKSPLKFANMVQETNKIASSGREMIDKARGTLAKAKARNEAKVKAKAAATTAATAKTKADNAKKGAESIDRLSPASRATLDKLRADRAAKKATTTKPSGTKTASTSTSTTMAPGKPARPSSSTVNTTKAIESANKPAPMKQMKCSGMSKKKKY